MIMDTVLITLKKSARLLWVEINLFGEIVEKVVNRGPEEMEKIEKLLIRLLDEKGYDDYRILSTIALSENQFECTVGKIAS